MQLLTFPLYIVLPDSRFRAVGLKMECIQRNRARRHMRSNKLERTDIALGHVGCLTVEHVVFTFSILHLVLNSQLSVVSLLMTAYNRTKLGPICEPSKPERTHVALGHAGRLTAEHATFTFSILHCSFE